MLRTVVRVKRLLMLLVLLYFAGILFYAGQHPISVFTLGAGYLFLLLAYTALFLYMRAKKKTGHLYIIPTGKGYIDHYGFIVLLIVSVFFAVLNYTSAEQLNGPYILNMAAFTLMYILFLIFPGYSSGLLLDVQGFCCPKAFFGVYSWGHLKMLKTDFKRGMFSIHVKRSASREIEITVPQLQTLEEGLARFCPPGKQISVK